MANVMPIEKRNDILRLLCEGNSIRSITRLMGTSIATVLRQLHWAADHCQAVMDREFQSLHLGFSKKLECLEWAVTLHMAYFNFCWQPATLADRMTPAMAAGVTNRPWSFAELMGA